MLLVSHNAILLFAYSRFCGSNAFELTMLHTGSTSKTRSFNKSLRAKALRARDILLLTEPHVIQINGVCESPGDHPFLAHCARVGRAFFRVFRGVFLYLGARGGRKTSRGRRRAESSKPRPAERAGGLRGQVLLWSMSSYQHRLTRRGKLSKPASAHPCAQGIRLTEPGEI